MLRFTGFLCLCKSLKRLKLELPAISDKIAKLLNVHVRCPLNFSGFVSFHLDFCMQNVGKAG
jgi:hypothetical protein